LHGANELALYGRLFGRDGVVLSLFLVSPTSVMRMLMKESKAQGSAAWVAVVGLVFRTHLGGE
jgi:hypothetical protein